MAERKQPYIFAVSGIKNSGKTALVVELIAELTRRGYRVATIKHDGHDFEPDRPGTDSYRHQRAGAYGTAVYSAERFCLVKQVEDSSETDFLDCFPEADVIILEGFKNSEYDKLEVVRQAVGSASVAETTGLFALVTDVADLRSELPIFTNEYTPENIAAITDCILHRMKQRMRQYASD